MRVVYQTCAGIDVHKRDVKVCLVTRDSQGHRHQTIRSFSTMTRDVLALGDWLHEHDCTVVAMESTGVYWKPIFNLLEGQLTILLVNPAHIKQVPGRKTDVKDCQWIAELLEHGLLKGSFIPPLAIRDLRDLTRYRRQLVNTHSAEVNRLQKILEDANIKLASVATDVMGVSGRRILQALLAGNVDPEQLAELAKGRLRAKKVELQAALHGRLRPHHTRLLTHILTHLEFLEETLASCEAEVEELCRPLTEEIALLDTAPGVSIRTAQDLLAEIGVAMEHFPSARHLCSWAKLSPGNNESAGKRRSGQTGHGNKWLRSVLVECAHAASHTKHTYLGAKFRRFAHRKGTKRAAVMVAHRLLEATYFMLRDKVPYQELGAQYVDDHNKAHLLRHHQRRLESLGYRVELHPLPLPQEVPC
jgi:transposase